MISDITILEEVTEIFDKEGFHQTEHWHFDGDGYYTTLENDNKESLPIRVDIEMTDEDIEEVKEEVLDNIDIEEIEEKIQEKITKDYKKEGLKQNNEWEYIPEDDVFWASYIGFDLEGDVVTMFPLKKEDLKKVKK